MILHIVQVLLVVTFNAMSTITDYDVVAILIPVLILIPIMVRVTVTILVMISCTCSVKNDRNNAKHYGNCHNCSD